jgi:hypothetical protein
MWGIFDEGVRKGVLAALLGGCPQVLQAEMELTYTLLDLLPIDEATSIAQHSQVHMVLWREGWSSQNQELHHHLVLDLLNELYEPPPLIHGSVHIII